MYVVFSLPVQKHQQQKEEWDDDGIFIVASFLVPGNIYIYIYILLSYDLPFSILSKPLESDYMDHSKKKYLYSEKKYAKDDEMKIIIASCRLLLPLPNSNQPKKL